MNLFHTFAAHCMYLLPRQVDLYSNVWVSLTTTYLISQITKAMNVPGIYFPQTYLIGINKSSLVEIYVLLLIIIMNSKCFLISKSTYVNSVEILRCDHKK
jgi:hypothetical protein